jgi:hypothetical protein
MAIAIRCPHCEKPYNLRDELAGKRVNCSNPNCKKPFTVTGGASINGTPPPAGKAPPKPVARSAEDIALAALAADERKAQAEAEKAAKQAVTQPISVKCEFCDHVSSFPSNMAGKNAPCQNEECRKIIKVPLPKKDDPKDWRTVAKRPTAARVDTENIEGAWGNVQTQAVSREALIQADLDVVEEAEPRSWRQIIALSLGVLGVLLLLAVAAAWLLHHRAEVKQEAAMENALAYLKVDPKTKTAKMGKEPGALLHLLEGEYELAKNRPAPAKTALNEVKGGLGGANPFERNAVLIEVAATQAALAGTAEEVKQGTRLDWEKEKLSAEVRRSLQDPLAVPAFDMHAYAFRKLTPILVRSGHATALKALASLATKGKSELLAVAGLELLAMGERDEAQAIAEHASQGQSESSPSLIALWLALASGDNPEAKRKIAIESAAKIAAPPGKDVPLTPINRIGYAGGWAHQAKLDDARKLAWSAGDHEERLRAGFAVALALAHRKADPGADLEQCTKALETDLKNRAVSPWLLLQIVQLCNEVHRPELAARVAATIVDSKELAGAKAWGQYLALTGKLVSIGGAPADYDLAKQVGSAENLAHWLAWAAVCQHNAAIEPGAATKEVKSWSADQQKAFGFAGIGLAEH